MSDNELHESIQHLSLWDSNYEELFSPQPLDPSNQRQVSSTERPARSRPGYPQIATYQAPLHSPPFVFTRSSPPRPPATGTMTSLTKRGGPASLRELSLSEILKAMKTNYESSHSKLLSRHQLHMEDLREESNRKLTNLPQAKAVEIAKQTLAQAEAACETARNECFAAETIQKTELESKLFISLENLKKEHNLDFSELSKFITGDISACEDCHCIISASTIQERQKLYSCVNRRVKTAIATDINSQDDELCTPLHAYQCACIQRRCCFCNSFFCPKCYCHHDLDVCRRECMSKCGWSRQQDCMVTEWRCRTIDGADSTRISGIHGFPSEEIPVYGLPAELDDPGFPTFADCWGCGTKCCRPCRVHCLRPCRCTFCYASWCLPCLEAQKDKLIGDASGRLCCAFTARMPEHQLNRMSNQLPLALRQ